MNKQRIKDCAQLGLTPYDKLVLGLFGLISPTSNSWHSKIKRLHPFVPKMWLRPRQLNGLQLLIDPTDWSQTVIFDEIFVRSSYDMRKVCFVPQVIIDCGGHIGLFSLLAKSTFPNSPVVVFEPNLRNAQFIRRLLLRNKLDISLRQSAVSTSNGVSEFNAINSHAGMLKRLREGGPGGVAETAPSYEVETVSLPDEIQRLCPSSLLLKMDIEGEERNVLPAIMPALPSRTAIFFETHFGETGWREIESLLRSNGFATEQINSRGLYCDGFAYRG